MLGIAAERLHFGEVWENEQFKWVLRIENGGPTDVQITDFGSSCACSKIEPRALDIPAGQSREVTLTLNLAAATTENDKGAVQEFQVSIAPNVKPPMGRIYWVLRGKVRVPFRFAKAQLDLGRHSELAQPLTPQTVAITGQVPLTHLSAQANSKHFRGQVQRSDNPPNHFELTLAQTSALPRGFHTFEVNVVPELQGGKPLPTKTIPVRVWIEPDIQASPPVIALGARCLGETVEETLTISSLTRQAFEVITVKVDGGGLAAEPLKGGTEVHAYHVRQRVTGLQAQNGWVIFRVRNEAGQEEDVRVDVTYHGLEVSAR
ncbi:MAG: DUF1573 domain-containing protein [Gemmataceae bacterium]|nr:DUF1573 domain-containing protein [Gemmataceae bacterium]